MARLAGRCEPSADHLEHPAHPGRDDRVQNHHLRHLVWMGVRLDGGWPRSARPANPGPVSAGHLCAAAYPGVANRLFAGRYLTGSPRQAHTVKTPAACSSRQVARRIPSPASQPTTRPAVAGVPADWGWPSSVNPTPSRRSCRSRSDRADTGSPRKRDPEDPDHARDGHDSRGERGGPRETTGQQHPPQHQG